MQIDSNRIFNHLRTTGAKLREQFSTLQPYVERAEMMSAFNKYDSAAAEEIRSALAKDYPQIGWLDGELENAAVWDANKQTAYWICDAIDGGVQFLRAIPQWCISLTLLENGRPTFAVILDVIHNEIFHAIAGSGAYLNGKKIGVNNRSNHIAAVLASSQPPFINDNKKVIQQLSESLSAILPTAGVVRNLGPTSLQLAYVACGRLDAFWEYGEDAFNCIGGSLLIKEAGGVVTDADMADYNMKSASIVAGSSGVHAGLVELLELV